ncbi:tRNA dihydrouridine synthase DusB [bacterium]|nr:tRNA dihydrouridine synthase DusB [bacterium]
MEISSLTDHKLWLAPLAGYTDNTFRTIAKKCGADVIVSEMVSADGLYYNLENSLHYAYFEEFQRPFGVQLFGSDADMMAKGAEIIAGIKPDFIDINMGCPVKKVINRMAGSALMKDLDLACRITEAVKEVGLKHKLLVTTKFRSGWDLESINYLSFGKALENSGSDALILHPRTRSQMFTGHSNWEHIRLLKESVNIPVVGNGDVKSLEDAQELYNLTYCDSIMIGRGALGKPWIFQEIKDFYLNQETSIDKLKVVLNHYELSLKNSNPNDQLHAIREMRSHFTHYSKGIRGGAQLRDEINHTIDPQEIFNIINKLEFNQ